MHALILLLLVEAAVVAANWCILHFWWQAMIRKTRWLVLFPVVVPVVLFGPMFVVGYAADELNFKLTVNGKFVLTMLWLLPTFVASYRGACQYRYSRRESAHSNV